MRKWIRFISLLLVAGLRLFEAAAQTEEIQVPADGSFLWPVVLTNGNFVVKSSGYSEGGVSNIGAVFLYDGNTKQLISTLKGSKAGDAVGTDVVPLPNGNFVVVSTSWDDGATYNVGAVTWVNGVTGLNGVVSTANSLTGSTNGDAIGVNGITVLPNGNYLVRSYAWRSSGKNNLGAVTWCDGNTGLVDKVSAANSLVGASDGDYVGWDPVLVLANGNYVVGAPSWDNGAAKNVGAVTWCNGATGRTGVVGAASSLIGSSAGDMISKGFGDGDSRLVALANGNYLVGSQHWKNGSLDSAGAVTWCNGATGLVGVVSAANSLVGGSAKDKIGYFKPVALTNGNYVVSSPFWKNGAADNAGAVTWCNGATGATGLVSVSNSLVGTDGADYVGGIQPINWNFFSMESRGPAQTVVPLTNGNYVVVSRNWNRNGLKWAGAVTWGNGVTGTTGAVTPANSLVGTVSMDRIGHLGVTALTNGHYVVASPMWSNGVILNAGAVTWCNGATGRVGDVTAANSFTGTKQDDFIGSNSARALTNGNYVIQSDVHSFNGVEMSGLSTFANGSAELVGNPDATNSLYGTHPMDLVGTLTIPMANGDYLAIANTWSGTAANTGAITLGNGSTGVSGAVSSSNSLVGTYYGDRLGLQGVQVLPDGNFFVANSSWNNNVGAVTWVNSADGTSGEVNDCNSMLGNPIGPPGSTLVVYNSTYNYLITYKAGGTKLVLYYPTGGPFLSKNADTGSATVNPSQAASLMGGTGGCRIIATVASQGANPVTGNVNAKTWVETAIPTFGGDPFVARHYEITPAQNAATATGRVTLYFSEPEFIAFNAVPGSTLDLPANPADAVGKSNLRIGKYAGISSDGSGLPSSYPSILSTIIDPDDNDIVWNDTFKRWEVTFDTEGFSGFVVQTSTAPLPVRLVSFTAKAEQSTVKLNWQIADAANFRHFEVERSANAKQFEYLGKVSFEETKESYSSTDARPQPNADGQIYYRLKMVDKDESYAYSKIVDVQSGGNSIAYVYPNPVRDHFKISLPGYDGKNGTLKLVNAAGETVRKEAFNVRNGEMTMDLNRSSLSDGIYSIQLDLEGGVRQFKILKTR
ncbi:T9SS type A sorting domain-containing protein [Dyadobacter sp. MSC1_007]|jgi:hypothetical protein|uniref:T9SS type A sorting domain-containing protein n=1 Tax=Dyadobacter sp. MSC1_007 TaxID=2909264 RepID=UPI002030CD40|nr:T9SS type A sorting domain-containing protein [Dyadobacter sp. MSC1_007]